MVCISQPHQTAPAFQSASKGASLFNPDPASYLPHRFPFLMLDALQSLEPGVRATATRRVTDCPEGFPQLLLLECIAQLAGIAAGHEAGEGGFLASIDHAEFGGAAAPGNTLDVAVRIIKSFGRLVMVEGEVTCDGRQLVTARMTLGMGRL